MNNRMTARMVFMVSPLGVYRWREVGKHPASPGECLLPAGVTDSANTADHVI